MLQKESLEIHRQLLAIQISEETIILNIGSQNSKYFKYYPHIKKNVYNLIDKSKSKLINFDLFPGEGVDISGDLYTEDTFVKLKKIKPDIILLNNVLEHVLDIPEFTKRIQKIVRMNGYIIFSGPKTYPKHMDPIDNLFRPEPIDLIPLFKSCEMIYSAVIKDVTYLQNITRNKNIFAMELLRILTPYYKFRKWRQIVIPKLKFLFSNFEVTVAVFQKVSE